MTATINNTTFSNAYNVAGLGGLIESSFEGRNSAVYGFGKFVQLGLVFSTIASVVPTLYSTALSMQNVGMWAVKIPRFIWNTIAFIVITVAAIAGRQHFAEVLSNFLNCLSYWYLHSLCHSLWILVNCAGSHHGERLCCWNIICFVGQEDIIWIFGGRKRVFRMALLGFRVLRVVRLLLFYR